MSSLLHSVLVDLIQFPDTWIHIKVRQSKADATVWIQLFECLRASLQTHFRLNLRE